MDIKKSLKSKIVCWLIVLLILTTTVSLFFTGMEAKESITEGAISTNKNVLHGLDISFTDFIEHTLLDTKMMALDERVFKTDEILTNYLSSTPPTSPEPWSHDKVGQDLRQSYKSIAKSHPAYFNPYLGTENGAFIYGSMDIFPAEYDPRKRGWYALAVKNPDKVVITEPYLDAATNTPMITTAATCSKNGKIYGVAAVDLSLEEVTQKIESAKIGENGFAVLIHSDGTILANRGDKDTFFQKVQEMKNSVYAKIFAQTNEPIKIQFKGQKYWVIPYVSPRFGWKLFGFFPDKEIMAPIVETLIKLFITYFISSMFICIIIFFFMDYITVRPMQRITRFLNKIKDGDYSDRILVKNRQDEIGQIFVALNGMSEMLGKNIAEILSKTEEAKKESEYAQKEKARAEAATKQAESAKIDGMHQAGNDLEGIAKTVDEAGGRITVSADAIYKGMDIQKDRIQSTATAMEEMSATILEVARNASDASTTAQQLKELAIKGQGSVDSSVDAVKSIKTKAITLSNDMRNLEEKAEAIGGILSIISDIADQTNLLALNAAIEAARAGEYGRGFAVVADEVRKLAEKTMVATKEVGISIDAVQEVVRCNATAMINTTEELEKTAEMVIFSGEVLKQIVEDVEYSAGQIQSIATAAEEQSATGKEINTALGEINNITIETERSVEETRERLYELREQMEEMNKLIINLQNA